MEYQIPQRAEDFERMLKTGELDESLYSWKIEIHIPDFILWNSYPPCHFKWLLIFYYPTQAGDVLLFIEEIETKWPWTLGTVGTSADKWGTLLKTMDLWK